MVGTITAMLRNAGAQFRIVHHPPTRTSEESARARGEEIAIGGKAIVMKVDERFVLLVISAAHRIDSRKVREIFRARKIRFATAEELHQLTGLVPGSVPPFGRPLFDLDLCADRTVTLNERIAFNAGSLTDSVVMTTEDYLRIAHPQVLSFGADQP